MAGGNDLYESGWMVLVFIRITFISPACDLMVGLISRADHFLFANRLASVIILISADSVDD